MLSLISQDPAFSLHFFIAVKASFQNAHLIIALFCLKTTSRPIIFRVDPEHVKDLYQVASPYLARYFFFTNLSLPATYFAKFLTCCEKRHVLLLGHGRGNIMRGSLPSSLTSLAKEGTRFRGNSFLGRGSSGTVWNRAPSNLGWTGHTSEKLIFLCWVTEVWGVIRSHRITEAVLRNIVAPLVLISMFVITSQFKLSYIHWTFICYLLSLVLW